jgi:hypothetical protein
MTGSRKNLPKAITMPEIARMHEGDGVGPVRGALEGREALDLAAGVGAVLVDGPLLK